MKTRLKVLAVGSAGALVALTVAGVAYAAIPDSSGVIHGCRGKALGVLRVIDSDRGQKCISAETPLDWNQTGPRGAVGPQGPAGGRVSIVYVTKHYNQTDPRLTAGYGHVIETVACPTGQVAVNGGVSTWAPDSSAPAGSYTGAAADESGQVGWNVEASTTNGAAFAGLPRPVDNNNGWRLAVYVALPSNATTFYPIDVKYYVGCS